MVGSATGANFPVTSSALQNTFNGPQSAFVAKLDASGHLSYATYLGGDGTVGSGIALDGAGYVYATGYTASLRFPTTRAAPQTFQGGAQDAFLTKLTPDGTSLVYSTYLGGVGTDVARAIVIDVVGNACIAGSTNSLNLPIVNAVQPKPGGNGDAMLACLNAAGTNWNFVTYLGGTASDDAYGLAIDSSGLYVSGATFSDNFPATSGSYQITRKSGFDAFVAKLNLAGNALQYATLVGGNGSDAATSITVDSAGRAWVAGYTTSTDFPLQNSWGGGYRGNFDAFVCQLSADGSDLLISGYMGGAGDDRAWAVAGDRAGGVIVTGYTGSGDFPTTPGGLRPGYAGSYDTFVTAVAVDHVVVGRVLSQSGGALPGTIIALTGSVNASIVTDSAGYFVFTNLPANTYTVTPANPAYFFNPASQSVSSTATGTMTFTGIPSTITISGLVKDTSGKGLAGATVVIAGGRNTSGLTDASGNYCFDGLPSRIGYTVLVYRSGYLFDPEYQNFPSVTRNQSADFSGAWNATSGRIAIAGLLRGGQWLVDYNGNWQWDGADWGDRLGSLGQAGDSAVLGDWNGDGRVEAGVFRNGLWVLDCNGNGRWDGLPGDCAFVLGQPGDIPVVGDWNGDGHAKAGVFRAGMWLLDYDGSGNTTGAPAIRTESMGMAGDIPVVGDWNGDGRTKIGIFRAGLWVLDANGSGRWDGWPVDCAFVMGQTGDIPVVGDWNGDGHSKAGVFRAGMWLLDYDGSGNTAGVPATRTESMGMAGDIPIRGDWNGDGRSKIGVFRNGLWVLDANGNGRWDAPAGGDRAFWLGQTGDIPVPSKW